MVSQYVALQMHAPGRHRERVDHDAARTAPTRRVGGTREVLCAHGSEGEQEHSQARKPRHGCVWKVAVELFLCSCVLLILPVLRPFSPPRPMDAPGQAASRQTSETAPPTFFGHERLEQVCSERKWLWFAHPKHFSLPTGAAGALQVHHPGQRQGSAYAADQRFQCVARRACGQAGPGGGNHAHPAQCEPAVRPLSRHLTFGWIIYSFCRIDDIEDNSKLRRGIPGMLLTCMFRSHGSRCSTAAHIVFGIPQTINTGNYMYFKCLEKVRVWPRAS